MIRLLAILLLLTACHGDKAKPAPPPRLVVEHRPCLDKPPPEPKPDGVIYDRGTPGGPCPEGYVMCLPMDAARNMVLYLSALHTWARDAFTACGPPPAAPAPAPGGSL